MAFYDKTRQIVVGNYDTFAIPFNIHNHIPLATESYVFTIRRVLDVSKRQGQNPELGEIVFQKYINYGDLIMIEDDNNNVIGCHFYVAATLEEAANIPKGINAYDLAIITSSTEFELIPPSEFYVGEVLRYV